MMLKYIKDCLKKRNQVLKDKIFKKKGIYLRNNKISLALYS